MPITDRIATDIPATIKTANYALLDGDWGREIQFQSGSSLTASLPPAGAAGNGYNVVIRNVGSGALTIEPAAGEQIDGQSDLDLPVGASVWIRSDGTEWKSIAGNSGGAVVIPYDMSFVAGYDCAMVKEDIAVQAYGELVIARSLVIEGEVGYIDTAPTGQDAIVDVEKNGVSVYSIEPEFAASSNTLTAGTLSTTTLASGDRLTFKVTQVGSTEPGEGLRFTLKCRLA